MLDLSNPEHREALRWACSLDDRARALVDDYMRGAPMPVHSDTLKLQHLAFATLSSPAESAAIVRALLEGCGVALAPFEDDEPARLPCVRVEPDGDTLAIRIVRGNDAAAELLKVLTARAMQFQLDMSDVPALILRLLSASTRGEALAALREVGR